MSSRPLQSDEELMALIKQDDHKAFETLFNRHWHPLFIFSKKLLNSSPEAEDIVQNVFSSFWEKRQQIAITSSLQAYFFQAVRYNGLKKLKSVLDSPMDIEKIHERFLPMINDLTEAMDHDELLQVIESKVRELPERTRTIFRMSRFDQLSIVEISTALGLSEQTVKNQLSVALKSLREGVVLAIILAQV